MTFKPLRSLRNGGSCLILHIQGELYGDNNEQRGGEDVQSEREKVGLVNLNAVFMFCMEMITIGLAVITFCAYKFSSGRG